MTILEAFNSAINGTETKIELTESDRRMAKALFFIAYEMFTVDGKEDEDGNCEKEKIAKNLVNAISALNAIQPGDQMGVIDDLKEAALMDMEEKEDE